jgi:hypothetical protein
MALNLYLTDMKKIIYILAFITCFGVKSFAQEDKKNTEKIEALKIAYITKNLNLSPEEAQRFWPVYNKYVAEIKAANQEQRLNNTSELDREDRILSIRKKYNSEFGKAISPERVNTFFGLERDFRQLIQKELQERRQIRQQRLRGN